MLFQLDALMVLAKSRAAEVSAQLQRSTMESPHPVTVVLVMAAPLCLVAIVYMAYCWWKRPKPAYCEHGQLLIELCRLQKIKSADRKTLIAVAESMGIQTPALLLTTPTLLQQASECCDGRQRAAVDRLQRQLSA